MAQAEMLMDMFTTLAASDIFTGPLYGSPAGGTGNTSIVHHYHFPPSESRGKC
jgi:hypothetical protein